jgi:5-methylcytosine-specific restriction endonuclease McrA
MNKDQKREYDRLRYLALREETRKRQEKYYRANIDAIRRRMRRYNAEHRERKREYNKRYRQSNIEKLKAHDREYRKLHPDKMRMQSHKKHARKRALPRDFNAADWIRSLIYFHGVCAYCGHPASFLDRDQVLHHDHFIPLSQGGPYTVDNILPACQNCNLSKHHQNPKEWLIKNQGGKRAKETIKRLETYFAWAKQQKELEESK